MESCIIVHDEKTIIAALEAFCGLGSDGGLGKGRIWILLDKETMKAKTQCANNLSLPDVLGTDNDKFVSLYGKKWKSKFQTNHCLGVGLHTWPYKGCIWVTVGYNGWRYS